MRNKPSKIILHCSDTPDDMDIGYNEIKRWHVIDNGWKDIGYHYIVRRNGIVELGRDEEVVGAHCKGHNQDSIGICMVGRDKWTADQVRSLCRLFCNIRIRWQIESTQVYGHYELDIMKACPLHDMALVRYLLSHSALHGY